MTKLQQLTRLISILLISTSCFTTVVYADASGKLPDRLNLLESVTIEAFEVLPDKELLQNSIDAYDKTLATDLAGSKWYTVDLPVMQTSGDIWLTINTVGFMKNLIVVTADHVSGTANVYFESDLLNDASIVHDSYWLKLGRGEIQPPTKIFLVKEFRDKDFLLRNFEMMTDSKREDNKSKFDIFTGIIFGAILTLLAYNLALAFQLKSQLHAFYGAYCLSNILLVFWYSNGLGFQASWYDYLSISPITVAQLTLWTYMAMSALFIIKFLEPSFRCLILVKGISYTLAAILTIILIGFFLGNSINLIRIFNVLTMLVLIQVLLVVVWAWRHGSNNAIYALLAFTPLFIIAMLRTISDQRGFFLNNGLQMASILEMLILSWALTERVRRIRDNAERGREKAEMREREAIHSINTNLERQVVERTKDLEIKFIELGKSNRELQNALDEISKLKGILPICSYCKNIRDDEGSWEQMESYISSHSDTKFSHGVCPDCREKVMEEFKLKNNK